MAVSAGLRSGTGSSPMPTCSRDVQASAAAADAIPPSKNESSHSHSCATPAASAASATARSRSGGNCGRNTTPNILARVCCNTRGLAQSARPPCPLRGTGDQGRRRCAGSQARSGSTAGPPTSRPSPASPRRCTAAARTAPGVHAAGPVALGHRRLTIIDLSERGAPADGRRRAGPGRRVQRLHLQLPASCAPSWRARATASSPPPTPRCCSRRYHRWGAACVDHFLGMFAFAVVERDTGRARPRPRPARASSRSTSPRPPGRLRFASHAARAAGRRRRRHLDRPGRAAPLHDVPLGGAGAAHDPRRASASCRRPPCGRSSPDGTGRRARLLAARARRAATRARRHDARATGRTRCWRRCGSRCDRRMVADVPVGVLLSGGIDSSLIVALLAEAGQHGLQDVQHRLRRRRRARAATSSSTPTWSPSSSAPTTTRS